MVKLTRVRFEHHETRALGIGECEPRISWSFEGDERDWVQSSYELEVRRQNGTTENHLVQSSNSQLVPWVGQPLVSGEEAKIRVRVTDTLGIMTEWSDITAVEAGLLNSEDWKCSLVEPAGPYAAGPPHRPVVFRHTIKVDELISKARLYVTAHGVYEARINGQQVGDHVLAPGWTSYANRLVYQTFDVTEHLQSGQNTIHVNVAEGWYCGRLGFLGGRSNIYGDRIGLIVMLVIEYVGGGKVVCGTDQQWQWAYGPILAAELYDGETYDAREQLTEGTSWNVVKCQPIADNLVAPDGPPVRRTQEVSPCKMFKSPSGKTIIDLGQNIVGWIRVRVDGPSGTTIQFQFAEVLEDGEVATRTLRHAKARDTLILSGHGPFTWEPKFTFHGFRYIQIDNWAGEPNLDDITGIVVHTDMRRTGYFSCSHPLLNKLHENVTWSMRGNFLSIPTDCPQRDERLGWTGDISVFADTANYLFDTAGMLSSWLRDLSLEQIAAGGIVPLTIPNIIDKFDKEAHSIWGDVAVMLPWSLYLATGDIGLLSRQYASMKAWLNAIPRRSNGLWNYTAEWKLGDWLDPAAPPDDCGNATTDPTLVSDAFLVHMTTLTSLISAAVDNASDTAQYTALAKKLRAAFADEYITASGLLVADTQTALALAIYFSLFPSSTQEQHAADRISLIIRRNSRFRIATGFAGTPFVGHALTKVGQSNLFYRMLLHRKNPSWLYPVTMGATTIWERWDSMLPDGKVNPGEMTSFNHYALGAVASWIHSVIAGLKIAEPGWRVFRVEPVPGGGLRWAEGRYLSGYGECAVRWEIKGRGGEKESFWVRVRVPPNTTAQVKLPGSYEVKIVGSGVYSWEVPYQAEEWPPRALYPPSMLADDELPADGCA
ncbi:glycoside hydrolase family 78 protein [Lipomyces starkeyi]